MRTLKNREEITDQLWEMLRGSRDERGAMEAIRALEYNYRQIDRLKAGHKMKPYEDTVLDQLLVEPKAENIIREERFMTRKKERKHCKMTGWLIFIVAIAFLAAVAASGCQTMAGACRDIESAARYGHEHMSVDE